MPTPVHASEMKHDLCLFWETFFSLLFLISYVQAQSSTIMAFKCSGLSYAANSAFETNLDNLFSSLSSKSSTSISDNTTAEEFPDLAYGLFLCLGSLPSDACQRCVRAAISGIKRKCSPQRRGTVWLDGCLLRYSDENFFGVVNSNGRNFTNRNRSKVNSTAPLDMMSKIVKQAPNQPRKFETFSLGPKTGFGMAQCTTDLSSEGCGECLEAVLARIKDCCADFDGWRYVSHSCWIRYKPTFFLLPENTDNKIGSFNCTGDTYSTNGGAYQRNLNNLSLSLISKSLSFYSDKDTIGEDPYRVYGLFLCQGNIPTTDCQNCITNATTDIQSLCKRTHGIIWYDYCHLRYSNESFFGVADPEGFYLTNPDVNAKTNSTAPVDMVSKLVQVAPTRRPLMFASNSSPSASLFGMAECTVDVNRTEHNLGRNVSSMNTEGRSTGSHSINEVTLSNMTAR